MKCKLWSPRRRKRSKHWLRSHRPRANSFRSWLLRKFKGSSQSTQREGKSWTDSSEIPSNWSNTWVVWMPKDKNSTKGSSTRRTIKQLGSWIRNILWMKQRKRFCKEKADCENCKRKYKILTECKAKWNSKRMKLKQNWSPTEHRKKIWSRS